MANGLIKCAFLCMSVLSFSVGGPFSSARFAAWSLVKNVSTMISVIMFFRQLKVNLAFETCFTLVWAFSEGTSVPAKTAVNLTLTRLTLNSISVRASVLLLGARTYSFVSLVIHSVENS